MSDGTSLIITGGIGSGKSSVSGFLAEQGWRVLDADQVGHEVLTDPVIVTQIGQTWPQVVEKGSVNRRSLGRIVFADHCELGRLEALVHPEIRRRIANWVGADMLNRAVEISVMKVIDRSWGDVVVMDAPSGTRVDRSVRRGLDADEVRLRLDAQPEREAWLAVADYLIPNQGSREELRESVLLLVGYLERR